jgi:pyruvate ferredoxin oxidoreductase gamma subunit
MQPRSRRADDPLMKELVFAGRGGEGVVLASQLLAETLARAGYHVQAFPEFKAERRGAPISAFVRWDERPIHRRYKIRDCDVLAVITPAPPAVARLDSIRPGGLLLLNRDERWPHAGAYDTARVPASQIARAHGVLSSEGRPMGNTTLLGALVRLLLPEALPHLEDAILARMGEVNVLAARDGYRRVTRQNRLAADSAPEHAPPPPELPLLRFPISTTDSLALQTGSWSLERPLVLAACTACGVCALFCPESAISTGGDAIEVDYTHCKGCGICVEVCPVRDAIALEEIAA